MLALVGATALWGTATAAIKIGLREFAPLTFLLAEFVAADALLWLLLWRSGGRFPQQWRMAVLLGTLEGAVNIADTEGLSMTTAGHASVLYGLESVFVVLLARVFLKEPVTRRLVAALALAVAGLIALGGVSSGGLGSGDLVIATAVACAAVYTICVRTAAQLQSPLELTAALFGVGTVLVLIMAAASWSTGSVPFPVTVEPAYWFLAALTGAGGLAAGLLLYNVGIGRVGAGPASVVVNLSPVFGLGTAALLLAEHINQAAIAGALLIGTSAAVVAVRDRTHPVTAPEPGAGPQADLPVPAGASPDVVAAADF